MEISDDGNTDVFLHTHYTERYARETRENIEYTPLVRKLQQKIFYTLVTNSVKEFHC